MSSEELLAEALDFLGTFFAAVFFAADALVDDLEAAVFLAVVLRLADDLADDFFVALREELIGNATLPHEQGQRLGPDSSFQPQTH